ncbi:3'-5' exonuclease [Methylobacterium planeticum]|uniref:DNA 3'-5' helicase n=1 Tax=Methylobacterium planeticum TaxID=2615211 RepID=A0A6N6MFI9_9HYPH|nr:3'-5' exonuclease [Methylobacterium planeticum]KAB1068528.1 AAA family ATPase [Methylobacterium planeticum]
MEFRIADTFTVALARLPAQEQKAVKTSAFDMQLDPSSPGLQFHRIEAARDPNFWSVRVNRDIRIIVHRTTGSLLLAYVDHHDKAYAWAERRRIEVHPRTGAVQIVESRERVEEAAPALFAKAEPKSLKAEPTLFDALQPDDLLGVGVPEDWIEPVRAATEARFFDLAAHLPAEAAEALLEYAATGRLPKPVEPAADPFAHPDAQRRFRVIEDIDALRAALDAPWERWSVFLHPSQVGVITKTYGGPARVAGSAGTGKTVVAVHRAVRLARADAQARVLLTTFSKPLADALQRKVGILIAAEPGAHGRITVAPWDGLADELHQLVHARRPRVATLAQIRAVLVEAAGGTAVWSERFLVSEFRHVVDAWQVADEPAYADTPRPGRRSRLGAKQRASLWPIFTLARARLAAQGLATWAGVFSDLAAHYGTSASRPFTHVVVDEAQDLGVPELRFLRALAPEGDDRLFFAGDLGQRIFQPPFSWKALGVDVRGRSTTLKVNYRTSHQIRETADRLLPGAVQDMDGREEARKGTVSVFDGPRPQVLKLADEAAEREEILSFLAAARADGIAPDEIGLFVRSRAQLDRARAVAQAAGLMPVEPGDAPSTAGESVTVGTMHLAKGLEFKAVAVLACDDGVLPLQERIDTVSDEAELEEVYETERHLLYVASTRARDRLLITGVRPGSEFLDDMG